MSILEFPEPQSPSTFDVRISVLFVEELDFEQTARVLFMIADVLRDELGKHLFDGLRALEVYHTYLTIIFTFKNTKDLDSTLFKGFDGSMLRMQFIFYLFAKIDQLYALKDAPFPSDFRVYLDLPAILQKSAS